MKIDGPMKEAPDVKPRRILSGKRRNDMMKESDEWLDPTYEESDDIKVMDHQGTRRTYKVLMIESLFKRGLWKVPMSKGT